MYRLTDELGKQILYKIKVPKTISSGKNAFTYETNTGSMGIIDVTCAIGTDFPYLLECPVPVFFPDFPYVPNGINAFFLYKKSEIARLNEPWEIPRMFVDPISIDNDEKIDVRECAIILPTDLEKLIVPITNTLEQLLAKEPLLMDCLTFK